MFLATKIINMFNSFKYNNHDIKYIKIDDKVWFKGSCVTKLLGYKSASHKVNYHVSDEDKMPLKTYSRPQVRAIIL